MISDLGKAIMGLICVAAVSVPLALWKLIDIAIWIIRHTNISFH